MRLHDARTLNARRSRGARWWCTLLLWSATCVPVLGGDRAHEHGEGHLELLVEGPGLHLRLEVPAESLLGFEHEPRAATEHAALVQVRERLLAAQRWLVPTPEAGCVIDMDAPPGFQLVGETAGEARHAGRGHQGHLEIVVEVALRCAEPAALVALGIDLFAHFPGLQRIRASVQTSDRQDYVELTPALTRIVLGP